MGRQRSRYVVIRYEDMHRATYENAIACISAQSAAVDKNLPPDSLNPVCLHVVYHP